MISDRVFLIQNRLFYSGELQQKPHGERDYCVELGKRDFLINFLCIYSILSIILYKSSLKKPISRFYYAMTLRSLVTEGFPSIGNLNMKYTFPDLQNDIQIYVCSSCF